mmetsp:Transcript_15781/g.66506  ORF Transcript_15781/g.66506 Transcript_15781/m.66506 type:complete len:451 (-) Transcript_15781:738-2090(-)
MRRTYFRQPRVLSRHFRAVVRNPPEGSYTQYTPVFAHRYASCTPGVFFSLSCKANPSRARRPTVTHIAFGSAAIAARASASSPAVPRSTPPPLTSARTRPGAGRSSSASAHAVPNVTVTFPSCGAGVAEDAAFAAATASLARSDIAGGAAVAADALGGFSFRRSPLSSNPDPSSKVKQTSLQGASWSTSKSATCHRYHVSSSSFASGARRENSTRATFLGGGGSPFSFFGTRALRLLLLLHLHHELEHLGHVLRASPRGVPVRLRVREVRRELRRRQRVPFLIRAAQQRVARLRDLFQNQAPRGYFVRARRYHQQHFVHRALQVLQHGELIEQHVVEVSLEAFHRPFPQVGVSIPRAALGVAHQIRQREPRLAVALRELHAVLARHHLPPPVLKRLRHHRAGFRVFPLSDPGSLIQQRREQRLRVVRVEQTRHHAQRQIAHVIRDVPQHR